MVDISSQNNKINVTVSSSGNTANTNVTPDYAQYYSEKSKEWAISNKIVDNTDYSSKYYANESKKQANISTAKTTEVIESGNNAVSDIENARDNAITDITNQESLSVDNVNTAGATQIANVNSAGTTQINLAKEQVALATNQANIATEQATIATNKASEVVASGNEALSNIDTAKNNAITSITNQETTSKTSLIDEGATQVGLVQNEGATQVANVQSTGFYMRDDKLYFINSQGEETEFKSGGSGLELCDIGMTLYVDETKGLRRYLNGQIVDINTNTQAFLDRLQEITTLHPSLLCTEEEWQTAKTMSAFGQVGKFVFNYSGDNIVSVRIPAIVNVQGLFDLQNLGITVSESLPNIKGALTNTEQMNIGMVTASGAFITTSGSTNKYCTEGTSAATRPNGYNFNASRSSSTYQDGAPVQPEAIQYPYFIQVAIGQETTADVKNELQLNNPYSLFDSKFSDHELNNLSWLKSEGQWNSGTVYVDAYNELLAEYNNAESVEETEGTVTFKRTPKGYKIALSTQETAILNKYNTDGIAWYYIIDTVNSQFKLPRTKFGFEGLRTSVGDDIKAGLPNIKTNTNDTSNRGNVWSTYPYEYTNGPFHGKSSKYYYNVASDTANSHDRFINLNFDASRSNPIYGKSNTVQPPATQMYLYFYVGETVQNANLIDAGRIGEQLAGKADKNEVTPLKTSYIIDTYVKGTSGYRIWSDGYCEQWGHSVSDKVSLMKTYNDTNYNVSVTGVPQDRTASLIRSNLDVDAGSLTVNSFKYAQYNSAYQADWRTCGYLASGQY